MKQGCITALARRILIPTHTHVHTHTNADTFVRTFATSKAHLNHYPHTYTQAYAHTYMHTFACSTTYILALELVVSLALLPRCGRWIGRDCGVYMLLLLMIFCAHIFHAFIYPLPVCVCLCVFALFTTPNYLVTRVYMCMCVCSASY